MPEEGAEPGDERVIAAPEPIHEENRERAFEHVADEGRGGEALVAGPQDIGRPDVARADGTQVDGAGKPGEDHAERDRSDEVAEGQRREIIR